MSSETGQDLARKDINNHSGRPLGFKDRFFQFYHANEKKVEAGFFVCGFLFDAWAVGEILETYAIIQQIVYLILIGIVLYFDFLSDRGILKIGPRLSKVWEYRHLAQHFFMGTLLNIYSLLYLKSCSFFSSVAFVLLLLGLLVANELKAVRKSQINIKICLYIICIFSFFSLMVPTLLGYVGLLPFLLSMLFTLLALGLIYRGLSRKVGEREVLLKQLVFPGAAMMALLLIFYTIGWIPPVPLAAQNLGVYHLIEKKGDEYILSHQNPWWRFWSTGDQQFQAAPGDKIYFFAKIFSPSRFNDTVVLHWSNYNTKQGWMSTDRVPLKIAGGRHAGYRGFSVKQNYTEGDWRVQVETSDGREIGRLYFSVAKVAAREGSEKFETTIH
jgi:hypothetical protein